MEPYGEPYQSQFQARRAAILGREYQPIGMPLAIGALDAADLAFQPAPNQPLGVPGTQGTGPAGQLALGFDSVIAGWQEVVQGVVEGEGVRWGRVKSTYNFFD